jgi:hypothetical protein
MLMNRRFTSIVASLALAAAFAGSSIRSANAHHSFAMYDDKKTYVFTGVGDPRGPPPRDMRKILKAV